jgi:hypothetical protein
MDPLSLVLVLAMDPLSLVLVLASDLLLFDPVLQMLQMV